MIKNITIEVDIDTDPEYIKLAQIAFDTVLATMLEGEKTHPEQDWQTANHIDRIMQHAYKYHNGDTAEDHIGHALTRCAMVKAIQVIYASRF